jgi:hypothetical protein
MLAIEGLWWWETKIVVGFKCFVRRPEHTGQSELDDFKVSALSVGFSAIGLV